MDGNPRVDMKLGILIPAYNEAAAVAMVVAGARRFSRRVLVVDDGSSDGTAAAARAAGAEVIRHPANQGKGAALRSGLRALAAGGSDPVIILDADGQHDPEEIPAFLSEARRSGAGIVIGNRMASAAGMPRVRYWTNRTMSAILSVLIGGKVPDTQCGYRLISAAAIGALSFRTNNYDTESEILIEAGRRGFRISSVPVRTIYGSQVSKIRPARDTLRFIRLLLRTWLSGENLFTAKAQRPPREAEKI